jgi:hypothetical protein
VHCSATLKARWPTLTLKDSYISVKQGNDETWGTKGLSVALDSMGHVRMNCHHLLDRVEPFC